MWIRQATDVFNRANGALSTLGWVQALTTGTVQIVSRALQANSLNDCEAYFNTNYWSPDQFSEITILANSVNGSLSSLVRITVTAGQATGYVAQVNAPLGSGNCQLLKQTANLTYTVLTSASFPSPTAVGDIIRLTVQGTTLTVTQNGNFVLSFTDATYATGFPGLRLNAITAVADQSISRWSAGYYSSEPGDIKNPWVPQGPVMFTNPMAITLTSDPFSTYAGNPCVIYEGSPKILTGATNVFKMWYGAFGLNYAESLDGINFTDYASNPVIASTASGVGRLGFPEVYKSGSTYYAYMTDLASSTWAVDAYTSSDGLTWTLALANCLGASQGWEGAGGTSQPALAQIDGGGTWWLYYGAQSAGYHGGLATATDGIHYTKFAGNPVVTAGDSFQTVAQRGGKFYAWAPANLASPAAGTITGITKLYTAPAVNGPWTLGTTPVYYMATPGDLWYFVGTSPVDTYILEVAGKSYLYYTITQNGTAAGIGCAIANMPIAQLVLGSQGVQDAPMPAGSTLNTGTLGSDNFTRANANPIGGNWNPLQVGGGYAAAQLLSNAVVPTALATNCTTWYAGNWPNDQWSQVTLGSSAGNAAAGCAVRCSTSGVANCYEFYWTGVPGASGTWTFAKTINGTATSFQTATQVMNVGDTLMIAAVGTNIYCYWNGAPVYAVSDSSFASGAPGVVLYSTTNIADAKVTGWSGGNANLTPASGGASGDLGPGYDFKFRL